MKEFHMCDLQEYHTCISRTYNVIWQYMTYKSIQGTYAHTHTQQGCAFGVGIMSLAHLKLIQLIRSGRRSTRWGPGGPGGPGREDLRLKPCRYDTNIIRHQVSSGQHVHTFVYMYTRIPIPTCDYMREVYGFVHAIISYPFVLLFARFLPANSRNMGWEESWWTNQQSRDKVLECHGIGEGTLGDSWCLDVLGLNPVCRKWKRRRKMRPKHIWRQAVAAE